MVVESVPVRDPLAFHYQARVRGRDSYRIKKLQPMDMRDWNINGSIIMITVSVMVTVLDDDMEVEAEAVRGGTEDDAEPLYCEVKEKNYNR